jgi:hypothetical protein
LEDHLDVPLTGFADYLEGLLGELGTKTGQLDVELLVLR